MAQNPLLKNTNFLYFVGVVMLLMGVQVSFMVLVLEIPKELAIYDALLHWTFLGLICFGLLNTFSFYHPPRFQFLIILVSPLVLVALWIELSTFILLRFSDLNFSSWLNLSFHYRVSVAYLLFTGTIGFSLLWYRVDERQAQENRRQETERMSKEAELFKLRQQIQPHFLFNALNSINSLIGNRPKDARQMVQKLSEFLRGTLKREEGDLISLEEELAHLNLYLDLEQLRFGHRLSIVRDIAKEALEANLPTLLVQPLIENAIKYGLYGTTEALQISLHCWIAGKNLQIEIRNPYSEDSSSMGGTGFGLPSIQRRLYLIYGRTDLLETRLDQGVYCALISIPQNHVQSTNS
jgi:two-component system LytT family sensor kinase